MLARIAIIIGALSFAGSIVVLTRSEAASSAEMPPIREVPDQLTAAVREQRDRLDEDDRSRWELSLAEGRRASLKELARKVHLSSVQLELLDDRLGIEGEKMLEVFRRVREDGLPMADARAQVDVIRTATDDAMHAELDADQFAGYEEMRPVYRIGGPPPGRR